MNALLIVRAEITNLLILSFLIIYNHCGARFQNGRKLFSLVALTSLGHTLFALITEITVNTPSVPAIVNDICHIIFFAFSLLFSLLYFRYALSLILPANKIKKYMIVAYILSTAAIVVMLLSDIDYLQGRGTLYSAGTGPTLCFMLGFIMLFLSDIFLIVYRKRIESNIASTLLPLTLIGIIAMVIQIVVPEFLFTSSALTIITLGVFLSLENPFNFLSTRAFIDSNTNVYNRNCFEEDVKAIKKQLETHTFKDELVYAIIDLNCLKTVNDTYGHLEGDRFLEITAKILMENLKSAPRVYRIGGDEFAALYHNVDPNVIDKELRTAKKAAAEYQTGVSLPLAFSVGYAELDREFTDMVRKADLMMYADKRAFYQSRNLERRSTLSID